MAVDTPWDIRIVNITDLTTVAYVPVWEQCSWSDLVDNFGSGSITFDFDEDWVTAFKTANGAYPWEKNYGVQILRNGSVIFTFIIEESEIEYAGLNRRRAIMGGRSLAACLEWAIVLPDGFDESLSDPDADTTAIVLNRGFGDVGTDAEIDAGATIDNPTHKGYGGGAFVYLFNEADTGNAQTWTDVATDTASRNGSAVTWPLSLNSNLSHTNDSNGNAWSHTGIYPSIDTTFLFTIPAGQHMLDVLKACAGLQANCQWYVGPTGEITLAKSIGTDRTSTVFLSIPNAVRSSNSLNRNDLRSRLYASNGYLFEPRTDSTANSTYGRREGYLQTDQSQGETVGEAAGHALSEVASQLDEYSFAYVESDNTQAWIDFQISDTVRIEYEPGVAQNRQITGLSGQISPTSQSIEVTVGDIIENKIGQLEREQQNNAFSDRITNTVAGMLSKDKSKKPKPDTPRNLTATPFVEGTTRGVSLAWKRPLTWENTVTGYEARVWNTTTNKVFVESPNNDPSTENQGVDVLGLGIKGGTYKAKVRSVGENGVSDWTAEVQFTMTAADEGTATDPEKPATVTGVTLHGMLNAIYLTFNDETLGTKQSMSGNRGKYEIQVSNASGGFNETTGNEWSKNIDSNGVAGNTSTAALKFIVPTGQGFICTGLRSESGGRTHYVRVRGINWDGTEGDWSSTMSISLDTDNKSQVGVWIGEEAIHANHIKSGTIETTQIKAGTLLASDIDAGQVMSSSIRLPQPAAAEAGDEVESVWSLNIDREGNIWGGDFATYADAVSGTLRSGGASADNWQLRIKGDGTEFFVGHRDTTTPANEHYLWYEGNVYNATAIKGSLSLTNTSHSFTGGGMESTDTYTAFGNVNKIVVTSAADSNMGYSGHSFQFGTATSGASVNRFGVIKGGSTSIDIGFGAITRDELRIGSQDASNYLAIYSAASGGAPKYGALLIAKSSSSALNSIAIEATTDVDIKATDGEVKIDADQGIEVVATTTPSTTTNKLWNNSGTLTWGTTAVGGGSGASWYFKVQSDSGEEIAEAANDFIDLQYPTASSTKSITITRSGNTAVFRNDVANHTAANLNAFSGAPYMIWGLESGGTNYNWKTTVSAMITYMTGLGNGGLMTQSGVYNTASLVNYTTTPNISTVAHPDSYAGSSNNSGQTFIQSLTINGHGHVTGISTGVASGGSSGITSVTASSSFGLFATTTGTAVSIGINWGSISTAAPDYTKTVLYDYGYGLTYKCSMPQATSAGISANLTMGSTTSFPYYITFTSGSIRYYTSRLATKDHITTVGKDDALARVKALRPVNFFFNDSIEPDNEMARFHAQRGFVAEEVAAVDKSLASYDWIDSNGESINDPEKAGKTLDDAVPVMYQMHAILADVVAALQQMESRIAALEG
ncbi:MAG: hypothetical protein CMM27_10670 [Rhodospirillaceae bacterium]|nr:hypothetical protein [Rhodospirillaceae bacterium]|tara:strand:+ start:21081 stop:25265 length:4185 start_codon:yes stop_codon:yes gene_type:complete